MRTYKTRASNPVVALLWENWRLTYLAFFVALALGAGVSHSLAEMQRLQSQNAWSDPVLPSYAICCFALFMYAAIVLYSLADPKALSMRIPSRYYSLPVRTGTMVAVQLAYRVASFSILALALFVLLRVEFGDLVEHGLAWDMSIAVLMFSYVLAVAWSWGAWRPLVTAALIGIPPLLAIGLAINVAEVRRVAPMTATSTTRLGDTQPDLIAQQRREGDTRSGLVSIDQAPRRRDRSVGLSSLESEASPSGAAGRIAALEHAAEARGTESSVVRKTWFTQLWEKLATDFTPVLFLLSAAYMAVAYVSGLRGRLGSITSEPSSNITGRIFGSGPRITSSAQQAQVWYEWRRKGLVLPGVTLALTFLFSLVALISDGRAADLKYLLIVPMYVAPFAAFFTGLYMLSVDYRHASSGLSTFLYTRPLSTDAYTRARLRMSAQSVFLTIGLCLALAVAGLAGNYYDNSISVGSIDLTEVPVYVFAFLAYGLLLWSLLWMSVPVLVYLLWFGCYFYYQTLVNTEFDRISEHVHQFWLIWIPAAVLVALTAFVWRHPTMWRSLSDATVARARHVMIVAFVAMGFCLLSLLINNEVNPFGPDSFEVISFFLGIVGLSTLPALSVLSQPLLLNRLRTR